MGSSVVSISSSSMSSDHSRMAELFQCLLRPEDRIIQTVRLEGGHVDRHRYLSIVCNEKAGEYCLLGIDCCSTETKHDKTRQEHSDKDQSEDIKV